MDIKLKQRVEILAQEFEDFKESGGGGGTTDAYTKAQSDAKFLSKSDAASIYQVKGSYATEGYVTSAIAALDVSSTTATGHVIRSIAQADGLIAPVEEAVDTTPTSESTHLITSGGVYAVVGNINAVLEEVL